MSSTHFRLMPIEWPLLRVGRGRLLDGEQKAGDMYMLFWRRQVLESERLEGEKIRWPWSKQNRPLIVSADS